MQSYGHFNEIKSLEVIYGKSKIKINNLVADCLVPKSNSFYQKVYMYIRTEFNYENFEIIINNIRLLTNLLLKLNRHYALLNRLLNVHHDIQKEPLLIHNLMIPIDTSILW